MYSACQSLPFHISGNPQLLPTESALAAPSLCWAAPASRCRPLPVGVERHTCACPALVSGSAGQGQSSQPSYQAALTPFRQSPDRRSCVPSLQGTHVSCLSPNLRRGGSPRAPLCGGGGLHPDPTKESFPKLSPFIPQTHLILSVGGKSF